MPKEKALCYLDTNVISVLKNYRLSMVLRMKENMKIILFCLLLITASFSYEPSEKEFKFSGLAKKVENQINNSFKNQKSIYVANSGQGISSVLLGTSMVSDIIISQEYIKTPDGKLSMINSGNPVAVIIFYEVSEYDNIKSDFIFPTKHKIVINGNSYAIGVFAKRSKLASEFVELINKIELKE